MAVVGLAGATGALGKEILGMLDRAKWRPERVVAMASASTVTAFVQYGDESIPVEDAVHADVEDMDLVILAIPSEAARVIGERAVEAGIPVVDCSGVFVDDGDVPLEVPWVNPEALMQANRGVICVPIAAATLLACALGPLRRAGLEGPVDATILLPASSSGRGGIDELSKQVVTLFNSGTPPRKVFRDGLAFDLIPQSGAAGEDGWTQFERTTAAQARLVSGWSEDVRVSQVIVPVFSGISAEVRLHSRRIAPVELIRQILVDGGVRVEADDNPRTLPRPRRTEGQPFPFVGRLRQDDRGTIYLWMAMDNLSGTASVVIASAGALLRQSERR